MPRETRCTSSGEGGAGIGAEVAAVIVLRVQGSGTDLEWAGHPDRGARKARPSLTRTRFAGLAPAGRHGRPGGRPFAQTGVRVESWARSHDGQRQDGEMAGIAML